MRFNRAVIVDENFAKVLRAYKPPQTCGGGVDLDAPLTAGRTLTGRLLLDLFESQLISRHMDLMSRVLRARNQSFYTISSTGHEGNVVLGDIVRHTDPAFLHYRSGALFVQRSKQVPGINVIRDVMLSFVASTEDPIAGGRHKVWGSKKLWVPPQTSTIASHIPKAVGAAVAIRRATRRGWSLEIPDDSIVLCSFGDASTNHASALAAINAARWLSYQRLPVPILLVCENNKWGISVRTPPGWIHHTYGRHPGLAYYEADGLDLLGAYDACRRAVDHCRQQRMPVFLHLKVVRLLGHAGSDMELEYRSVEELEEVERQDPLLASAKIILDHGLSTPEALIGRYEAVREHVTQEADYAVSRPKLQRVEEIVRPLAPFSEQAVHEEATRPVPPDDLVKAYAPGHGLPTESQPRHLAVMINYALREMMTKYPHSLLFGEDVARKGGVYHVTAGLSEHFGLGRVFNTLLDEQDILGMALGAGHVGLLPIPEIQYLAYFHNACDQIRGEAASLQFFSNDQFRNPMVVRIASFAYQKGFGGHFHNDNTVAPLRDIPGVIIAAPSRGDDAVEMMRTCFALAKVDGRVVLFLEPIALYMTKDLYKPKDGGWLCDYPPQGQVSRLGAGRIYHPDGRDLTIISYCNGLYLSLRAAKTLREQHRIGARVVDLRWLKPLNEPFICEQAATTGRLLVVDETRRTGGMSEAVFTALIDQGFSQIKMKRIAAADSFIPLGDAATRVLPSEEQIVTAALSLCQL